MLNRPVLFLLLAATLGLASCAEPKEPLGLSKPAYFDLEHLLANLQKQLTEEQAKVKKTSQHTSGQTEVQTLQQVNWQHELELFSQAAINRPAWRGEFTADTLNSGGNLTIRYSRNKGSNAPVEYLQVTQNPAGEPQHISARISSSDMLFDNAKLLELHLQPNAPGGLKRYQVSGNQKLVFARPVQYSLQGEVLR